jgi:hypothetical protein
MQDPTQKITKAKRARPQVVELLSSKYENLSSNPSTSLPEKVKNIYYY